MAIPKVMGTEVEYGITLKGDPDFDPISSCVLLVNAYREDHAGEILWDYDQENPLADARGFQVDGEKYTPNQQENIARNKTLINGARYYVDHAHPEYSCPEVTNVRDLVIHEKAGERVLEMALANAGLSPDAIGYVSAHGTATDRGDIAESHATFNVFGENMPISSIKSYMGHTLGACGALESWLSAEMMNCGWFAPTINLDNVDPECATLDYIRGEGRDLDVEYVMNNNFAFGGINTSLIFRRHS